MFWKWAEGVSQSLLAGNIVHSGRPSRSTVVSLPYYVFHVIAPQVLASLGLIRLHGSAIGYAGWSKEGSVLPVACIGLHIPV